MTINELRKIIKKEILTEVSYRSFNKKIGENTPKTKINKAIREIKRRIKEINK
jgi:hypothetical protein